MTADAVTARVLDHRGRGVRLERRWTLDELRGDGVDGVCEPYRGAATRPDVLVGFSAVVLALLGPLVLAPLALIAAGPPADIAAGAAIGSKMVRTLSSLEKGKRRNYVVSASKEAACSRSTGAGPLQ